MITAIHPQELPDLLARVRPDIALLSLDCFDTLIRRGADAPNAPAFGLGADARHPYAFTPTVALMRSAREQDLPIAIVTDTRLGEAELRALIAAAAGEDILALVDHVFCSSDYGVCQREGLFEHLLRDVGIAPERIVHLGGDESQELDAAGATGINTVHLLRRDPLADQRLRLEAAMESIETSRLAAGLGGTDGDGERAARNISRAA